MRKVHLLYCSLLLLPLSLLSQQTFTLSDQLLWADQARTLVQGNEQVELWQFAGGLHGEQYPGIPVYYRTVELPGPGLLEAVIDRSVFAELDRRESPYDEIIGTELEIRTRVERHRNRYYGIVEFVPLIRNSARFQKLTTIDLRLQWRPIMTARPRGPEFATASALRDGQIFKIAVKNTGLHKLTYGFLKDQLGLPLDNIDPRQLQVLGQRGGMTPVSIEADRVDDLAELAVFVAGEEDGSFDPNDYVIFYAEGPHRWYFNATERSFHREQNIYDTHNYYFIKIGSDNGQRVATRPYVEVTNYVTDTFDDYARFEEDRVNLLYQWNITKMGAGQRWFGDYFKEARSKTYPGLFDFPNLVASSPIRVKAEMALRANRASSFSLTINGERKTSSLASGTKVGTANDYTVNYANTAQLSSTFPANQSKIDVLLEFPRPGGVTSEGWLDFIEVNARRQLILTGDQLDFRDINSLDQEGTAYRLQATATNLMIWDVTDPLQPVQQEYRESGGVLQFGSTGAALHEWIAFRPAAALLSAEAIGPVVNQDLHAHGEGVDMLIVYPEEFTAEARRLADHRETFSGLRVVLASTREVYNEFSSGRQDPTAIRDFARMLHDRSDSFRYLLLFGDGSFDARDLIEEIAGTNFIPTYQQDSYNSIQAFPADDYYGILNNTTNNPLSGTLDVAVGRLPVKSVAEAQAVVEKIIHYDTSPRALGDWRNRLVFVGDDEDGNRHTGDADDIAERIERTYPTFNVDKIYLDAYPQVSSTGGDRFPAAKDALNNSVFKGTLAMTYLGHGGPKGWAQERVLDIPDIRSWRNYDNLVLLITATCSFTGYDDPSFVSAGEEALLNPRGGAIALLTTTRPVYASANAALTDSTLYHLFQREQGTALTLGEAMQRAKNGGLNSSFFTNNSRKFTLIGDPATRIPLPGYQVRTTTINGEAITSESLDTLRAFQKVTVAGEIVDSRGQRIESMSGTLFPTIFDKELSIQTLGQDASSRIFNFKVRKNVIFKGKASITDGRFQFTFVVPKDINFAYGPGKISYYAAAPDLMLDANGEYERIIIGGTQPGGLADTRGPEVEVFMNTEDFVFGGITGEDPTLLVKLSDDNGINVVGNSIGHDLEAVLNEDTENTYVLNDFYEAEADAYNKGTVRYPLYELPDGRHRIQVKAWDIANNSSVGYTEFIVASSADIALRHVLNYPNPFTDQTCFQFDHNLSGQSLDVRVQIYTVSGRLVKTLDQFFVATDGAIRLDDCISWDGRDEYGDQLARGIYLYKIKVRAADTGSIDLNGESDFQKLVILR